MNLKDYQSQSQKKVAQELKKIDLEKAKQVAKAKILKNSYCVQFIADNQVSERELMTHLGEFLTVVDEGETNIACTKEHCVKGGNGYHVGLRRRGLDIELYYYACAFRENLDYYAAHYLYHDFPDEWLLAKINDIKVNNYRHELIKGFKEVLTSKSKSLYIYGEIGLGKSFTVAAFCNKYIELHPDCSVAYLNTRKLVNDLRDLLFNKANEEVQNILQKLKSIPVLVFDDFGSEKITEWSKEDVVYNLVSERQQQGLITIFTSDFSLTELAQLYGKKDNLKNRRLFSLLKNYTQEIELIGVQTK